MICEICGKNIPRGQKFIGARFKSSKFCSAECYQVKCDKANLTAEERQRQKEARLKPSQTDPYFRKFTDFINDWWTTEPNWAWLMSQAKDIRQEYELDWKTMYLVLVYCRKYERLELNPQYGLGQFFPRYIDATLQFQQNINKSKTYDIPSPTIHHIKNTSQDKRMKWRGRDGETSDEW